MGISFFLELIFLLYIVKLLPFILDKLNLFINLNIKISTFHGSSFYFLINVNVVQIFSMFVNSLNIFGLCTPFLLLKASGNFFTVNYTCIVCYSFLLNFHEFSILIVFLIS